MRPPATCEAISAASKGGLAAVARAPSDVGDVLERLSLQIQEQMDRTRPLLRARRGRRPALENRDQRPRSPLQIAPALGRILRQPVHEPLRGLQENRPGLGLAVLHPSRSLLPPGDASPGRRL